MKKFIKIITIIIAVLSAVTALKIAIDYCCRKYKKTYIKV